MHFLHFKDIAFKIQFQAQLAYKNKLKQISIRRFRVDV